MGIYKKVVIICLTLCLFATAIFACIFFYGFKTDYSDYVKIASQKYGVSESLIFAVIKAESKFNAKVESKKGAIGLMQLMPSTANYVLKKLIKEQDLLSKENNTNNFDFDDNNNSINVAQSALYNKNIDADILTLNVKGYVEKDDLYNAKINIILGTKYLKYLIDKFKNEDVAICAYNAGETNVRAWLNNKMYSKDEKTLIDIPFVETKNYLKKVNFNKKIYKKMLKN